MNFISKKYLKLWTKDTTYNVLTSIPSIMVEKVSVISQTTRLETDYILLQGQSTTKSFNLISFVETLLSITTTRRMTRNIFKNRILRSKKPASISYVQKCTTNTYVKQMQKYRVFFIYFNCTHVNNQMVANNPHLSVNDNTLYENTTTIHSFPSTVLYNYMYEESPARTGR